MNALAWNQDSIDRFQSVSDIDPFGPIQTPAELLFGCLLFEYKRGEQAALVALRREVCTHGVRVHVQAMTSTAPGKLQTRHLIAEIEGVAANLGGDFLTLCTPHKQIIDGAKRWGGNVTGAIIAKQLKGK